MAMCLALDMMNRNTVIAVLLGSTDLNLRSMKGFRAFWGVRSHATDRRSSE
jgi:hypothetical protein